jgi:sugar phosphate isomerase/epimerase
VRQIHVKDALPPAVHGEWGSEVPVGHGAIDWRAVFEQLRRHRLSVDFMIEREAGSDRVGDMRRALQLVERMLAIEPGSA